MNSLQIKALKQAEAELKRAEHIVITKAGAPEFGSACRRDTPAGEVTELIRSAQQWIDAVLSA